MSHETVSFDQSSADHKRNDLISADRVAGTIIYDLGGERLGKVETVMIDKIDGKVAYVVVSFGGVIGIGEKHHPLPWHMLDYDTQIDGYRVDMTHDQLVGAPSYDRTELAGFDRDSGSDVDRFYQANGSKDDGVEGNRSDLNDGIDRPLGFYSRKAQSMRNGDAGGNPGVDSTGLQADEQAPGFYSPGQQEARSNIASIDNTVGGVQAERANADRINDPHQK